MTEAKLTTLWRIRRYLAISPEEIVRHTSISRSQYWRIERGLCRPSINTANEILYGLNMILTSEKRASLWHAGLLPERQRSFMLLDLHFTLYRRR